MSSIHKRFISETAVVIVLYKTPLENSQTFKTLSENLRKLDLIMDLIVYDNSPIVKDPEVKNSNWNVKFFNDITNAGVSKAYNVAAQYANALGKKWVLLVDQDTTFPVNSLNKYIDAIEEYPAQKVFVPILKASEKIISPCFYAFKRGFHLKQVDPGLHTFNRTLPVNSGALINLELFKLTGGYNEKIKLDFSDFYFFEKVRKISTEYVVLDLICHHDISTQSNQSIDSAAQRHIYYCEGAKAFSQSLQDRIVMLLVSFFRSLKLSMKFREILFVKIWLKKVVNDY